MATLNAIYPKVKGLRRLNFSHIRKYRRITGPAGYRRLSPGLQRRLPE